MITKGFPKSSRNLTIESTSSSSPESLNGLLLDSVLGSFPFPSMRTRVTGPFGSTDLNLIGGLAFFSTGRSSIGLTFAIGIAVSDEVSAAGSADFG